MKRPFLLLPIVVALHACSPSGPRVSDSPDTKVVEHSADNSQDYFPLAKGNSWTYAVTGLVRPVGKPQTGGTMKSTMKVINVKESAAGKSAEINLVNEGKTLSRLAILVNDKGVFQSGAFSKNVRSDYKPPIPMLLLPAKPGQKFTYSGVGVLPGVDGIGPLTSEMTFRGESMVDTNAGRMKALRFDAVQKYKKNGKSYEAGQSAWFVPKVGLVRSVEIVKAPDFVRTIEMKLESYTVK